MLKIILVDDEQPALEELMYLMKQSESVEVVGTYTDPAEAMKKISSSRPDAVFLDIEMPEINGLNFAREIAQMDRNIDVVFVTAFNEYAVEAFELNAVDYILKPIYKERLIKTIDRIASRSSKGVRTGKYLIDKIQEIDNYIKRSTDKISAWDGDDILLLKPYEVLYLAVEDGSTAIVTKQGRFKTKESLDMWEDKLRNQNFFRCHRSYLVNLNCISKIIPWFGSGYIVKVDGLVDEIPVSRNRMKELKKVFNI